MQVSHEQHWCQTLPVPRTESDTPVHTTLVWHKIGIQMSWGQGALVHSMTKLCICQCSMKITSINNASDRFSGKNATAIYMYLLSVLRSFLFWEVQCFSKAIKGHFFCILVDRKWRNETRLVTLHSAIDTQFSFIKFCLIQQKMHTYYQSRNVFYVNAKCCFYFLMAISQKIH